MTNTTPTKWKYIHLKDLINYLRLTGWEQVSSPNNKVVLFEGSIENSEPVQVVLPSNSKFVDTPRRIEDTINFLAEISSKTPQEIVQQIRQQRHDIFSVRVVGEDIALLPLNVATRIVSSLYDFMAAAASMEDRPRPYFPKSPAIGRDFTLDCQFGHTSPGSFGFSVESPVAQSNQVDLLNQPPFGRRVMERIIRGLFLTQEAVFSEHETLLLERYEEGLNANMCYVLLNMLGKQENIEIVYSVSWSPQLQPAQDVQAIEPIRLGQQARGYLETTAHSLQAIHEARRVSIQGRIKDLRTEISPTTNDVDEYTVVIRWQDSETKRYFNVHVNIDPQSYRFACNAHRDKQRVSVEGQLEKKGKFWTLLNPQNFRTG